MVDDIILHGDSVGSKQTDSRAESAVETASGDGRWRQFTGESGIQECQGVTWIVEIGPALLPGVVELDVADAGIT